MDQIEKALRKLSGKERQQILALLGLIEVGKFQGLNLKRLVGSKDTYRIRKGDLRIVFRQTAQEIRILRLERRSTTTYRHRQ